ncbi:MAG: adenine phosphoribosyltransferase [Candidatus Magasanikbacteria bacterium]|nr:adenine phosphoribosyltransferase [Candidatus Magasanikbacteria bacterium]
MLDLKSKIVDIPNWPIEGVVFKDITPLLQDAAYFKETIDRLAEPFVSAPVEVIVGIDARGFLLATAVAYKLGVGVALVRKPGKLPRPIVSRDYALEYGSNTLEMHKDAIKLGERVGIVDDVLATGGTLNATIQLIEELGGTVECVSVLIGLSFLNGKDQLGGKPVHELITY